MSIIKIREKAVKKVMIPVVVLISAALLVSIFVGFGSSPGVDRPDGTRAEVAFVVNETEFTDLEYLIQLQNMRERMRQEGQAASATNISYMKAQLIPSLVTRAIIATEAEESGIRVGRRDINREYDRMVDSQLEQYKMAIFGPEGAEKSDRELEAELRDRANLTIRDIRDQIEAEISRDSVRMELLVRGLEESVRGQKPLSDSELEESYREVTARQIFITKQGRPEAAVKSDAEEVLQKVRDGDDFAELAREHSDDMFTANNGGLMPPIKPTDFTGGQAMQYGQPAKEVRDAALRMENPGDLSELIETDDGFYIVKLESSEVNLPEDFEENKDQYREQQQMAMTQQVWIDTVENAIDNAEIEFKNPEFEAYWLLTQSPQFGEEAEDALEKAAEAFQRHIYQNRDSSAADTSYIQLAMIQERTGKTEEAAQTLEQGLRVFEDGQTRMTLARLYKQLGEEEKAKEQYVEASHVSTDWMVHMELQRVFTSDFPDAELAQKSEQIVQREIERQQQAAAAAQPPMEEPAQGDDPASAEPDGSQD